MTCAAWLTLSRWVKKRLWDPPACCAGIGPDSSATQLDRFALDSSLVVAAGRAAQDFFRDAERHLRDALALQPAATELAYTITDQALPLAALTRSGGSASLGFP